MDRAFSAAENDLRWRCAREGVYALYHEMEQKDAHLFSVLQTRRNALLACAWKVVPAAASTADTRAAATVEQVLRAIPNLQAVLYHLLDAQAKGYALAEIVWASNARTGAVWIESIVPRQQCNFAFDAEGELYLLEALGGTGSSDRGSGSASPGADGIDPKKLLPRPGELQIMTQSARRMPARKFLRLSFQGTTCSPYGSGLCEKAYWYYWFKRNNVRYWSSYNERSATPTAVAKHSSGTDQREIDELKQLVGETGQRTGIVLTQDSSVEYLQAQGGSTGETFRALADWCNDEISKVVLGQTLTTSEGRRSGSLALGTVHERVRRDYLAADARALGEMLTEQLSRWVTDFNFGTDVDAPRVVFDFADPAEFATDLQVDRELVKMGVSLPRGYFYEKYRRPAPSSGERELRYDDANLYQYHLMFGVLTINEVRATLGLEPVAWGDHPPQAASTGRPDSAAGMQRGRPQSDQHDGDLADDDGADEAKRDRHQR
jgi:phage gp29-like protein